MQVMPSAQTSGRPLIWSHTHILTSKLGRHGFEELIIRCIKAWLDFHRQKAVISGSVSTWMMVMNGVLQGSKLGTLFFNLH